MSLHPIGGSGYAGSRDGANKYIGTTLEIRPAMIGMLSKLGCSTLPAKSDEIPKTLPLCWRSPVEPWWRSRAPSEVFTGVNMFVLLGSQISSFFWYGSYLYVSEVFQRAPVVPQGRDSRDVADCGDRLGE